MGVYADKYTDTILGEKQYERAYSDWKGMSNKYADTISSTATDMKSFLPTLKDSVKRYEPGGKEYDFLFGEGARNIGSEDAERVNMGMSGLYHGQTSHDKATKLSTAVEMTTASMFQESLKPYLQLSQTIGALMQGLSGIMGSMPNYASSIKLGTPNVTGSTNITPGV